MKNVHVVIPGLFLPPPLMREAVEGLDAPILRTMLARAAQEPLAETTLETWLCKAFDAAGVAPVRLAAEGIAPGSHTWMCADPVHLYILRDKLILQDAPGLSQEDAGILCASLNAHFTDFHFIAPHPNRWYMRLNAFPGIATVPLPEVAGRNVHDYLPQGRDALKWHAIINEIQMLLFNHPLNKAREARGELPANSLWLWGEGRACTLGRPFERILGAGLVESFARAANIPGEAWKRDAAGGELIVFEDFKRAAGEMHAWRAAARHFETEYAAPLWAALRKGRISGLVIDAPCGELSRRFMLDRRAPWKFWRRAPLNALV